ncbi:MAG: 2,5-furandicarboxylate decarboxylase 1 [Chloroflexota bacterium]|jgi:2,5-furandicarboxylate decarboxylase 1|nr:2,5-furandicarboxylate decarboxylase 1 [Chloroflexota bacterium]
MPKDLRSFVDELAERRPDELKMVSEPVDPRFGMTAVAAALERRGQFPALYFQHVRGSELPAVVNLTASYERLAMALGTTQHEMVSVYSQRQAKPIPPRIVEDAPVKEVIWTGADADLTRLPIPTHNELDGGPYLTAASLVTRHPETGIMNVGLYRHQVYGPQEMGVWFITGHHGQYIHQACEALNRPMPVAISIGHHPAVIMGAVSRIPGMGGEYDEAGGLLGEPLELVKCETNDLLVPARAEIVIEGVIEPGVRREEGPFAEWPGLYTEHGPKPVIKVLAITMRRDAVFYDVFAGHREHQVLGSLPRMGSIYSRVKDAVPGVKAVNVPAHVRMHCYISFTKRNEAEAKKAALAALLTEPENLKTIVLVDDDIDVFNEPEVMWAIGTRFAADRDLHLIPGWSGPGGLIPTSWEYFPDGHKEPKMVTAMIIDATKPLPPAPFPPRVAVPAAAVDAVDLEAILKPFNGADGPR